MIPVGAFKLTAYFKSIAQRRPMIPVGAFKPKYGPQEALFGLFNKINDLR